MTNQSESINELATALSKAQSQIRNAEEDKNNPHFKSKYATLTSLWDACRDPLTKYGLCVVQTFDDSENRLRLVTTLMHSSGQWIRSSFPIMQSMKIQETGSATTYARRYSLSSIVGIAPGDNDDDDGEKAMGRHVKPVDNTLPINAGGIKDGNVTFTRETADIKLESPEQIASKEEVDILLSYVTQTPKERQDNFHKILASKGWENPYKMSKKFCDFQKDAAKVLVKMNEKKTGEEGLPF